MKENTSRRKSCVKLISSGFMHFSFLIQKIFSLLKQEHQVTFVTRNKIFCSLSLPLHAYHGEIINPSNTFSSFFSFFPPNFWHINASKLNHLFSLVLLLCSYCTCFLVLKISNYLPHMACLIETFLAFLILGYWWFSFGILRRDNMMLLTTKRRLCRLCVAGLFHLFKSESVLNLSLIVCYSAFLTVSNIICVIPGLFLET